MFGDFVDEELENQKTTAEETDVEEEDLEDDFDEEYSDEDFEDSEEEIDDEDKTAYQILMEDLVEKGVLFADEDKEYDIDEDGIEELLEDTVNARVGSLFQENEDLAMLYDVVQNGGSIQDVMEIYGEVNYSELDMSDEGTQEQVVIDYYTAKGISEDRIARLIDSSKDDGSFGNEVEEAYSALVNSQRAQMREYLENLEQNKIDEQEYAMEQMVTLRQTINSIEEIQGFKMDKRTKDDFFSYMTQPTNSGMTRLQEDAQDYDKQLVMAFMYYTNFNAEDLQRRATTNVSEKLSKALKSQKDDNIRSGSSGSKRNSNIDDFDDIII
jgi:topoisomerase-4 subunit A